MNRVIELPVIVGFFIYRRIRKYKKIEQVLNAIGKRNGVFARWLYPIVIEREYYRKPKTK